jgi:thiol:disulfide interchange protein DsbD
MKMTSLLACLIFLGVFSSRAQTSTRVRLFPDASETPPGTRFTAAVELTMAPGWHTYWRSPGDAGQPTKIAWTLPPGFSAGAIQWPVPEKLIEEDLVVNAYSGVATLLIPVSVEAGVAAGRYDLSAKVSWLECEKSCIKGTKTVTASIVVGPNRTASPESEAIALAKAKIPPPADFPVSAAWIDSGDATNRTLSVKFASTGGSWDLFPDRNSEGAWSGRPQLEKSGSDTVIKVAFTPFEKEWPTNVSGLLVRDVKTAGSAAFEFSVPIASVALAAATGGAGAASDTPAEVASESNSFLGYLVGAFLGGLILNIMPCVLPVIALKILGFVGQASQNPGRVRTMGLVYGAGVLASFLALALLVIGVKAAGGTASWGMQFQNPKFLVAMTALVVLVALNLFGVFEVVLGGGAMQSASDLAGKDGLAGAFFNGVLATLLATPCTAPFLGVSLGFALAQPSLQIVLFFLVAGLGLAFPYVLLCWQPAWLRYLPKPGNWMVSFKVAMGFPVLATGLWLFTLTTSHYGADRILWLALFLVTLSMAAWVYGRFVQTARSGAISGWVAFAAILAVGYFWFLEGELKWRQPPSRTRTTAHSGPINWENWSTDAVQRLRQSGRPVLVDFTADWCTTCQINKRRAIEVKPVIEKIQALNVAPLIGDFSFEDEKIAAELKRFKRAGVPLVLVYPADISKPPVVLPDGVFSPSTMIAALENAAGR